jgi:peptidoglycan/xylan/chitin deacetylase (PgdA/CDA1 family)
VGTARPKRVRQRFSYQPGFGKRLVMLWISVACFVLAKAYRSIAELIGGTQPPSSLIVLTYHSLAEEEIVQFDEQMRDLAARATPVFADASASSNGRPTVAVTFDDGFRSVFDHALPVMAKYHVPATIFVPTGFLGAEPGWIDPARRTEGSFGRLVSSSTLASTDHRHVRLGSHTVTHPFLAKLPIDSVRTELTVSKGTLEGIVGATMRMLSLPYGSFNASVLQEARAAGYERVFANVPVCAKPEDDPLLLGRINVTARDWPLEFRLKVQGAYQWLALAVPTKRAVLGLVRKDQEA